VVFQRCDDRLGTSRFGMPGVAPPQKRRAACGGVAHLAPGAAKRHATRASQIFEASAHRGHRNEVAVSLRAGNAQVRATVRGVARLPRNEKFDFFDENVIFPQGKRLNFFPKKSFFQKTRPARVAHPASNRSRERRRSGCRERVCVCVRWVASFTAYPSRRRACCAGSR